MPSFFGRRTITTHSACNLGFIFDEHLTFSDQISALSLNLAIIIFVNFSVFVLISTSKPPVPSSLLSFILFLITATHYSTERLQDIQYFIARAAARIPRSSHITRVLKSLQCLRINERINYNYFLLHIRSSQQTNLNISTTWFLFNLPTTYVFHLWSLLPVNQPDALWKSLIVLFSTLYLASGTERTPHWTLNIRVNQIITIF